jgi:tetratricopeptide (TPR) repeat protein
VTKEYDKALEDCSEALGLNPQSAQAFRTRGHIREKKREYGKAIADFNKAVELNPKDAIVVHSRGCSRAWQANWEGALADMDEVVRLNSKYHFAYSTRGLIRAACPDARYRDAKKALDDSKRACELSKWKNPDALGSYAAACAENEDFAEAVKWQKKVLDDFKEYVEEYGPEMRKRLKLYEAKRPFRLTAYDIKPSPNSKDD